MSDAFVVDTSELRVLADRAGRMPGIVPDELTVAMQRSVIAVQGEARKIVPVDTGRLRNSIAYEVQRGGGGVIGRVGSNVEYARYVEEGTRPHFPPVSAVAGWANRHGIPPFLVARAIARHGTRARPYLRPALATMRPKIDAEFKAAITRILAKFGGR